MVKNPIIKEMIILQLDKEQLEVLVENAVEKAISNAPPLGKNPPTEKPITTRELCKFLGITEPTVIRWRKKGKIPFLQVGSAIRFNLANVIKALEVTKKRGG